MDSNRLSMLMRLPRYSALAVLLVLGTVSSQAAGEGDVFRQSAELLMPYSVLTGSPEGTAILEQSMLTTIGIQNGMLPNGQYMSSEQLAARRQQANFDASGSWELATTTISSLGTTFEQAYWNAITEGAHTTRDDGKIYKLFNDAAVNNTTSTQIYADAAKYYFAGSTEQHAPSIPFAKYDGQSGVANVYLFYAPNGKTYQNGNPRPLQLWSALAGYDAQPQIEVFQAHKFDAPTYQNPANTNGVLEDNFVAGEVTGDPGASFPSGHTTFGTTSTLLYAMMAPELYQNAMLRQSEFGESRIYEGFHHTLDVIGGRILGTYTTVEWLRDEHNWKLLQDASSDFRTLLINGNLEQFQQTVEATSSWSKATLEQNQADFDYRMTYGLGSLDQSKFESSSPDTGAMDYTYAALLFTTRYPYFVSADFKPTDENIADLDEIADIITSTLLGEAGPLDNSTLYEGAYANWSRIDLFAASGGYRELTSNVTVTMDASQGPTEANPTANPLWVKDTWSNDMHGAYTLTKTEVQNDGYGPTRLTLSGDNAIAGVQALGGELVLTGTNAFSASSNVGDGGVLVVTNGGSLNAAGGVTVASGGILKVVFAGNEIVKAGAGGFVNNGSVILYADPTVNGGTTLQPVASSSALSGTGSYTVYGGQWNAGTGTVTVSQISQGTVNGYTGTFQNFILDGQRVGFAFGGGENDIIVSLVDSFSSLTNNLTVVDIEMRDSLQLIGGQSVVGAFEFDTSLEASTPFLSFNVGENFDAADFMVWYKETGDSSWSLLDPTVFNYNGEYFSFAAEGLGSYAVTAIPEPQVLGLLGIALLAFRRRRR